MHHTAHHTTHTPHYTPSTTHATLSGSRLEIPSPISSHLIRTCLGFPLRSYPAAVYRTGLLSGTAATARTATGMAWHGVAALSCSLFLFFFWWRAARGTGLVGDLSFFSESARATGLDSIEQTDSISRGVLSSFSVTGTGCMDGMDGWAGLGGWMGRDGWMDGWKQAMN